ARFAAATQALGKHVVEVGAEDGFPAHLRLWFVDELGRAALLHAAASVLPDPELVAVIWDRYARGEGPQAPAVPRALPILRRAERFLELAIAAGRSSASPVFEAIAYENGYPARHFPAPPFNHLVLRSLFNGVPLARIVGLAARVTPELQRLALAYARERRT